MSNYRALTDDEIRSAAVANLANRNMHVAVAALDRYTENGDAAAALHELLTAVLDECSVTRTWNDSRPGRGSFCYVISTPYMQRR